MIVDAVEHIGQISLGIQPIHLGRLDDRHGTRQGFRSCVGSCEEPIASSDSNRAQGSLSDVVVHGDAAIFQEQAE